MISRKPYEIYKPIELPNIRFLSFILHLKVNINWYKFNLYISPCSVRMRENTDQKNSDYEHFSRSVHQYFCLIVSPNNCSVIN